VADPTGTRTPLRTALLWLIALGAAWACFVWASGGVDLRPFGIPFRSTNLVRILYATIALVVVYVALFPTHARHDLRRLLERTPPPDALAHFAPPFVGVLSVAITVLGVTHGVFTARSADEYGYLSQADLWLAGHLTIEQPIAREVPWPNADWTFAPMGYRPLDKPGTIGPVYAPGLPVLMAAGATVAGECGKLLVTPLLGGLLIALTYLLGARLWSPVAGLGAAILLSTSPTFLFMLMAPMADVPAAAFFTLGLVLALSPGRWREFLAGVAVSTGIFVRPNLVPLGLIVLVFLMMRARAGDGGWRAAIRAAILYGIGGAPLVLAVAAVNSAVYGAPWASSYGDLGLLFSWSYPLRNVTDYGWYLWRTETPLVLCAAIPVLMRRVGVSPDRRWGIDFIGLFAVGVFACYLFYLPLGNWWSLRFLLPAFPAMLALACIGLLVLAGRRFDVKASTAILFLTVAIAVNLRLKVIRSEPILTLWQGGVSYLSAADYVRRELPGNAVVLAYHHAGSIRYYAHRLTMRWDLLAPEWWPRAVEVLVAKGYRPYLLLAEFEEQQFRQQFGLSNAADAPGTIIANLARPERLRIYDPLRSANAAPADEIPQRVARPCHCIWHPKQSPRDEQR
jgi:hypothetical protein